MPERESRLTARPKPEKPLFQLKSNIRHQQQLLAIDAMALEVDSGKNVASTVPASNYTRYTAHFLRLVFEAKTIISDVQITFSANIEQGSPRVYFSLVDRHWRNRDLTYIYEAALFAFCKNRRPTDLRRPATHL